MSLQLYCINYGNFYDAIEVLRHCFKIFDKFDKVTLLHPDPCQKKYYPGLNLIRAKSKSQNECFSFELPQYITCDYAIGIQWDGFIVNPSAWTDDFLKYDWIAPPWPLQNIPNPDWRVGSGGFCMFSRRMSQLWPKLIDKESFNDWQIGATKRHLFEERGMKYAPIELAMRFGEEIPLEDQPKLDYTPFGIHGKQYDSENRKKYFEMIYGRN